MSSFEQFAHGSRALVQLRGNVIGFGDHIVQAVVHRVIFHKLADGALSVVYFVDDGGEFIQGAERFLVKGRVVDEQADGAILRIQGIGDQIDLVEDGVEALDGALAGLNNVLDIGGFGGGELGLFCTGPPFANFMSMSTTVSPACPGWWRLVLESSRMPAWYFLLTLMVTSTGVGLRSGTMRMPLTLPTVTTRRVTGAPTLRPAEFSK